MLHSLDDLHPAYTAVPTFQVPLHGARPPRCQRVTRDSPLARYGHRRRLAGHGAPSRSAPTALLVSAVNPRSPPRPQHACLRSFPGRSSTLVQTSRCDVTSRTSSASWTSLMSWAGGRSARALWPRGCSLRCRSRRASGGAGSRLRPFLLGFVPNVIQSVHIPLSCSARPHVSPFLLDSKYPGTADMNATVLFSARYDSHGSFGSVRAPDGDKDGSSTTTILALARAIGRTGVRIRNNLELVLFGGGEQGPLRSEASRRSCTPRATSFPMLTDGTERGSRSESINTKYSVSLMM
jgi:hypothetical protein